ncbi:hypothetical protein CAEBREN_07156 [Caenorhabditis brenneri]|uniref:GIY-YIG domain-containing protein n=1 Tax=Caenorhabditis brenneri TaxID=135651 RepID=G0NC68_CAEBE|nr:hypothetical protein CAEBREN_07156 [Caenorhabditis brenneri]
MSNQGSVPSTSQTELLKFNAPGAALLTVLANQIGEVTSNVQETEEGVVKDNKREELLEDTDRKRKIEEEDSPADSGFRKAQRIGDSAQKKAVGTAIDLKAFTFSYHPGFSMDREQFKEAIEANCRLDQKIKKEFEGSCKAFCYILLDPRILGEDVENLEIGKFLGSIFYVGKGSSSRPLQHFKDVLKARKKDATKLLRSPKMAKIDELWREGLGVPKHEFFHGCSHDEAYVREASMIFMLQKIQGNQLANIKPGTWKGSTIHWNEPTKYCFGYSLLEKAYAIFKIEGIRCVSENSLRSSR